MGERTVARESVGDKDNSVVDSEILVGGVPIKQERRGYTPHKEVECEHDAGYPFPKGLLAPAQQHPKSPGP